MQSAGFFGSAILEVAIGLIFLYFLLSTIASSIHELIASALKWRAKNLEWALGNLLNDPTLLRQVLHHPLIRSLGQNASRQRGQPLPSPDDPLKQPTIPGQPSYIPSRAFALAVMHSLANPSVAVAATGGEKDGSIDMTRIRSTVDALASSHIPDGASATVAQLAQAKQLTGQVLQALLEECRDTEASARALDALKQRLDAGLSSSSVPDLDQLRASLRAAIHLDAIREVVAKLPSPERTWASSVVDAGARDIDIATYKLDRLRSSIETWFDQAMDRAAGVYKRNTLKILAIIALVLSLLSGADSVNFVSRLYVDSAVRAQLAEQASQSTPQSPDITKAVQSLEPFVTLFGYSDMPSDSGRFAGWVILKGAGEAITVFAILLGAPFWFDLLSKLVNVRGTGPKPASTTKSSSQ